MTPSLAVGSAATPTIGSVPASDRFSSRSKKSLNALIIIASRVEFCELKTSLNEVLIFAEEKFLGHDWQTITIASNALFRTSIGRPGEVSAAKVSVISFATDLSFQAGKPSLKLSY